MKTKTKQIACLCCGGPTIPDPAFAGTQTSEAYCQSCDAAWHEACCVVCGEIFLVDVTRHRGDHHCDPVVERRIEAGRRRHASPAQVHSVGARLNKGFKMWHADER